MCGDKICLEHCCSHNWGIDQNQLINIWLARKLPTCRKKVSYCRASSHYLRNRACFEKKVIKYPTDIVCYAVMFLNYWADLHKEQDKMALQEGVRILQQKVVSVHPRQVDNPRDDGGRDIVLA